LILHSRFSCVVLHIVPPLLVCSHYYSVTHLFIHQIFNKVPAIGFTLIYLHYQKMSWYTVVKAALTSKSVFQKFDATNFG